MKRGATLPGLLVLGLLCVTVPGIADTPTTHHVVHKKKQPALPPPLPSGPRGPVPQVPLDAMPAVAPQVTYEGGLLTIVAPNSTLSDILRGVRKHTSADIDIPASANERVVTRIGPGPARDGVAELLNGSHFNYVLLGSPQDASALVKVVLVAKTGPDNPAPPTPEAGKNGQTPDANNAAADAPDADTSEESNSAVDDSPDQGNAAAAAEGEQPANPDQPGVKTPQQMLQEMQQRQIQMQQGQQATPGQPQNYPPGMPFPGRPMQPPQQPPTQQQDQ
ncbi:MAG TPA: hypothetical protein VND65_03500 [Candidatus Binatia bacterium]|nr:hypothetical protein [Candidatus Binatia bacterium]